MKSLVKHIKHVHIRTYCMVVYKNVFTKFMDICEQFVKTHELSVNIVMCKE